MSNIKTIRDRLGLTQTALANGLGCSQGNIGHYENKGQTMPPDVARRLIAFAAGRGQSVSYEDIYGVPKLAPALANTAQPATKSVAEQAGANV